MSTFVHLHNRSHYSILTALAKPDEYIEIALSEGMPALALTDNGHTYGLVEFYKKAKKAGIKPILGMDIHVAPLGHTNKTPENRSSSLVLLAKNNDGYQNLLKLSTIASLEGFYYRPRIDDELLKEYGAGLIALSGGLGGAIPKAILENDLKKAKELIKNYQNLFGKDSFYLEIQDQPEVANWSIVNKALIELSKVLAAPLIATNDCYYANPEDAEAHDVLICVQNQKNVDDPHRFRFTGDHSMRSVKSMREAFKDQPEAIENTLKIAEQCNVELTFGEHQIPHFDTGKDSAEVYLKRLCLEGFKQRYGAHPPEGAQERLEYELETIHKMGFDTYFLIVHDFVDYAKRSGIVVGPGRGSAAGSIIAYCLRITDIDPLKYGLLFERFLNPERISMPDIDIDFADTRREEVLQYVSEKYGEDRVAQIITFGTLAPKAAIRDAGRTLGFTYSEVDAIAKTVPPAVLGKYAPLAESIQEDPELSKLYQSDANAKKVLDMAEQLEGTIRQVGTHACAVIISRDPLVEHTALQKAAGSKEGIVTQYSMKPCEDLGLLKMDFLGLKNLSILETTIGILKRTRPDVTISLDSLPLDDEKAFELLQKGQTTGVFQLESSGMKRYLKELKPTEFGDIIAMVSLYRPGPMQFISDYIKGKHGTKEVEYLHPSLEKILKETYGIAIYQEQILEIAKQFAGFSLGEADLLRRAIGKKIAAELTAQRQKFIEGAISEGHDKALAIKMFDDVIEPFAGYGFNKSHAACYALIAYQTAYMKAHFTAEFMAALLTADADNTDRVVIEIEECRELGIDVLPPDVNESRAHFTVVDDKTIRFGLTAIKGIGEGPVRELLAARESGSSFNSLADFAERVPAKLLNKKTIESLAYSGAMDSLGERAQIGASYEELSSYAKGAQKNVSSGQTDIFGVVDELEAPALKLVKIDPASDAERLRWEKEYLGLYVSGHPLQGLSRYFSAKGKLISNLNAKSVNNPVKVTGMVSQFRRVMTKKGDYMCFGELEDVSSKIPFVLFPKTYDRFGDMIEPDIPLRLSGRLTERRGEFQISVDEVKRLSLERMREQAQAQGLFNSNEQLLSVHEVPEEEDGPFVIALEASQVSLLNELKALLEANKGDRPVEIHISSSKNLKRVKVPFGIKTDALFKKELDGLINA